MLGKTAVYYNDNDPFCCAWLRQLMADGLIPEGFVDERSIQDVQPADLAGYRQCHFFAGIGGWAYALAIASWGDAPAWTGSCPCQPFSAAGKGASAADPRHLWPAWFRLIAECRPVVVFGEQVASVDGLAWFDAVSTDLEAADYAVGAVDLPACSVGAPHIRQRLWFVANAIGSRRASRRPGEAGDGCDAARVKPAGLCNAGELGDSASDGRQRGRLEEHIDIERERGLQPDGPGARGFWDGAIWIECADGKARPTQPGLFPLAHGVPNRVGILRGAGNAIVPQVAATFIQAYLEAVP